MAPSIDRSACAVASSSLKPWERGIHDAPPEYESASGRDRVHLACRHPRRCRSPEDFSELHELILDEFDSDRGLRKDPAVFFVFVLSRIAGPLREAQGGLRRSTDVERNRTLEWQ